MLKSARLPTVDELARCRPKLVEADDGGKRGGGGFFGGLIKAFGGGGEADDDKIPPSFDAPLDAYQMCTCYNCEIPATVAHLWAAISSTENGLDFEGIFRLTPDPKECARLEADLKSGRPLDAGPEIHAHLIKSFFRRLPPPGVLGGVPIEKLVAVGVSESKKDCAALLEAMRPRERALLEWLLRVILEVNANREVNKMTLRNQCVVWAPNLRLLDAAAAASGNPADELKNVDHVSNAIHALCTHAFRQLRGTESDAVRASRM